MVLFLHHLSHMGSCCCPYLRSNTARQALLTVAFTPPPMILLLAFTTQIAINHNIRLILLSPT